RPLLGFFSEWPGAAHARRDVCPIGVVKPARLTVYSRKQISARKLRRWRGVGILCRGGRRHSCGTLGSVTPAASCPIRLVGGPFCQDNVAVGALVCQVEASIHAIKSFQPRNLYVVPQAHIYRQAGTNSPIIPDVKSHVGTRHVRTLIPVDSAAGGRTQE